uniref:phenylalanine 4-monooxygenase n=1 Tax=Neospora caninum (strain Liverpool) TaxID=572307 RepID=F0JB43_NEOCL|nr:Phenylalanine-4-hydroxylase, related [Neospora caninum Liverpool]CEL71310.1 TPA: Phenylalanine-4-hydroxylase, related [Neospora caninum Liverpool]
MSELTGIFAAHKVSITEIRSTPDPLNLRKMMVSISFEGDWESENVKQLVARLRSYCAAFSRGAPVDVPWFPQSPEDLDRIASHTLDAGKDLEADHPGFLDAVYRKRRQEIAAVAENHRGGQAVRIIDYTPQETATWKHLWGILTDLYPTLACNEYNEVLTELRDAGLYGPDKIPQVAEVNEYIHAKTGFTLRPVAGLLAARDFMNALAFRTFFSTQYIRHHSAPLYTPEPDVVHELLGHAPLLANPVSTVHYYSFLDATQRHDDRMPLIRSCSRHSCASRFFPVHSLEREEIRENADSVHFPLLRAYALSEQRHLQDCLWMQHIRSQI